MTFVYLFNIIHIDGYLCKAVIMEANYVKHVELFKALSDINRLMIVDMLSYGELCACKILEKLRITQPTLSHHMKTLCDCGLVNAQKEGKWMYYSLNKEIVQDFKNFLCTITTDENN